jgi:serine carboxypeptidase-like clade 2
MFKALLALALFACFAGCMAADASQRIDFLPGVPEPLKFKMYSGYVPVDEVMGKNLFYWFVESERDPKNDPLLVWMNGGPGASSLLGLFTEHGPFRPMPHGLTLEMNPFSWNKFANIIYLEAPVGVGFSYASNPAYKYDSNDSSTAQDNYFFLQKWFDKFPEYRSNDFYVTGESYGGHYVPTLANVILDKNLAGRDPKINIKGIMVGNPGTEGDWFYYRNEFAFVNFMFSHALIPQSNYTVAQKACGWNEFLDECKKDWIHPGMECQNAVAAAMSYVPNDVDLYGIYFPFCNEPSNNAIELHGKSNNALDYVSSWNPMIQTFLPHLTYRPCVQNYLVEYMNVPLVQQAIHVLPTKWNWISSILQYGPRSDTMVPLYQRFFRDAPDWRILVFSGDGDGAVPFLSTQRWIECLKRPIKQDWSFWRHNRQVIGAYKVYDRLTMLTLKGCGHMVSMYCPEEGFVMFDRWINNKPF